MVAFGMLALVPLGALLVRFMTHDLSAVRRMSTRRALPGTRVRVEIEVRNMGERRTAMLLVEDQVPPSLGVPPEEFWERSGPAPAAVSRTS
jgi:hypothetical protein